MGKRRSVIWIIKLHYFGKTRVYAILILCIGARAGTLAQVIKTCLWTDTTVYIYIWGNAGWSGDCCCRRGEGFTVQTKKKKALLSTCGLLFLKYGLFLALNTVGRTHILAINANNPIAVVWVGWGIVLLCFPLFYPLYRLFCVLCPFYIDFVFFPREFCGF